MSVSKKKAVIDKFKASENDTGSAPVQIALLTMKINMLVEHLKSNKKDFSAKRGLTILVSNRKSLLSYLQRKSPSLFNSVSDQLSIRRSKSA